VQSPLATCAPLEVLDRVRDVDTFPVDICLDQSLVEKAARGSHERMPGEVLLVTRLLADEEDLRRARTLAEHGLCRARPEIAAAAVLRRLRDAAKRPRVLYARVSVLVALGHRIARAQPRCHLG
jgi:hypothetical protein